jgi:hypothetical protein
MKLSSSHRSKYIALLACAAASPCILHAADYDESEGAGFYVRLDAVARFNIKASLKANNPVLPAGVYNDGFVLPDVGGSSATTWNWGYNNAAQLVGSDLVMHRFDTVPAAGNHDLNLDSPQLGGEIVTGYRFTEFEILKKPARFGIELGYSYTEFSQGLNFSSSGSASYTTANFPLNGIVPPVPPYAGTFNGPGPLISVTPNATSTIASAASTAFQGKLDATFQNFRIGPSIEIDLTKRFSLGLGAGYSSVYARASLKYNETTTFADATVPTINSTVDMTRGEWEPGLYFEIIGNYQFTQHLGAFLGGDFQHNNALHFGDTAHQVNIDLGSTYAAKAGLTIRF